MDIFVGFILPCFFTCIPNLDIFNDMDRLMVAMAAAGQVDHTGWWPIVPTEFI
jgi:hypothetical protein